MLEENSWIKCSYPSRWKLIIQLIFYFSYQVPQLRDYSPIEIGLCRHVEGKRIVSTLAKYISLTCSIFSLLGGQNVLVWIGRNNKAWMAKHFFLTCLALDISGIIEKCYFGNHTKDERYPQRFLIGSYLHQNFIVLLLGRRISLLYDGY